MIDSSLRDGPWDEFALELDSDFSPETGSESWSESDAWLDEEPWIEDGTWGDSDLSESLTLKYLGPQAVRAA